MKKILISLCLIFNLCTASEKTSRAVSIEPVLNNNNNNNLKIVINQPDKTKDEQLKDFALETLRSPDFGKKIFNTIFDISAFGLNMYFLLNHPDAKNFAIGYFIFKLLIMHTEILHLSSKSLALNSNVIGTPYKTEFTNDIDKQLIFNEKFDRFITFILTSIGAYKAFANEQTKKIFFDYIKKLYSNLNFRFGKAK